MKKLSKRKIFYTYVLMDPRKPGKWRYGHWVFHFEPFYVGKGSNNRRYTHASQALVSLNTGVKPTSPKGKRITSIIKANQELKVRLVKSDLTEKQAFDLEHKLIILIGRKCDTQGPLLNLTLGGEGFYGFKPTYEHVSRAGSIGGSRPKSQLHRERISKALLGMVRSVDKTTILGRKPIISNKDLKDIHKRRRKGECWVNITPDYPLHFTNVIKNYKTWLNS